MIDFSSPPIVQLIGNATNAYFHLSQWDAKLLGLTAHPSHPDQLRLRPGFDGNAVLVMPTGRRLTAVDLTQLYYKATERGGWCVRADDPLGFPPSPLPEGTDLVGPAVPGDA